MSAAKVRGGSLVVLLSCLQGLSGCGRSGLDEDYRVGLSAHDDGGSDSDSAIASSGGSSSGASPIEDGGDATLGCRDSTTCPSGEVCCAEATEGGAAEGGTVGPPSCRVAGPGRTNCGPADESCCTSLEVAGGTFFRTYTNDGSGPTTEADAATVSTFRLDKYAVTVGRFRMFVKAWSSGAGYTPPTGSGRHGYLNGGQGLTNSAGTGTYEPGWLSADDGELAPTDVNLACGGSVIGTAAGYATWTSVVGGGENVPINCITWQEAYAFCIWDGGFLPSEAEWEYAAAGGNEQREYPWGTTAPGTANQYAIYDCHYPSGQNCFGVKNIAPVGTATSGAGLWGQLDLAGNLGQWTLDSYVGYVDPCTDCAFATAGSRRVFRGGVFSSVTSDLLPPARSSAMPASRDHAIGFRCARAP